MKGAGVRVKRVLVRLLAVSAMASCLAGPVRAGGLEPTNGPCRVKLRTGRVMDASALVPADEARAFWKLLLPGGGTVVLPVRELRSVELLQSEPAPAEVVTVALPPEAGPEASMGDREPAAGCDPWASTRVARWSGLTSEAAERHGVDVALIRAIIAVESCGNPDAVSPKGALGLMQLMPATAREYGCADPKDPRSNVDAGARHLARLIDRLGGNLDLVVAAYNAGEGAVAKAGGIPKFRETRSYVKSVKRHLANLNG